MRDICLAHNNYLSREMTSRHYSNERTGIQRQISLFASCSPDKYRKRLLVTYGSDVKLKMEDIASRNDFEIDTIEVDEDHIHLMVTYPPNVSISQIVRVLKGETTYYLWNTYPVALKKQFWRNHIFWYPSYFACSVGNASQEVIRKYIANQGN